MDEVKSDTNPATLALEKLFPDSLKEANDDMLEAFCRETEALLIDLMSDEKAEKKALLNYGRYLYENGIVQVFFDGYSWVIHSTLNSTSDSGYATEKIKKVALYAYVRIINKLKNLGADEINNTEHKSFYDVLLGQVNGYESADFQIVLDQWFEVVAVKQNGRTGFYEEMDCFDDFQALGKFLREKLLDGFDFDLIFDGRQDRIDFVDGRHLGINVRRIECTGFFYMVVLEEIKAEKCHEKVISDGSNKKSNGYEPINPMVAESRNQEDAIASGRWRSEKRKRTMNNQAKHAHVLSLSNFELFCKTIYKHTGIVLDQRKKEMVNRRLYKRMRSLGISHPDSYFEYFLENTDLELSELINVITTNHTAFFRENHHFSYLADEFMGSQLDLNGLEKLRIWSSASSSGEEPYSIIITVLDYLQRYKHSCDFKLLATDIDTDILEVAKKGEYQLDRATGLTEEVAKKWFLKSRNPQVTNIKVKPELSRVATFKKLNLLSEWNFRNQFDVIFCRNVMIYFDKKTQEELIPRFSDVLRPGGILFIGHSETLPRSITNLKPVGKTTFKKVS